MKIEPKITAIAEVDHQVARRFGRLYRAAFSTTAISGTGMAGIMGRWVAAQLVG